MDFLIAPAATSHPDPAAVEIIGNGLHAHYLAAVALEIKVINLPYHGGLVLLDGQALFLAAAIADLIGFF
ncbi:hypothetical protein EVC37_04210 [Methylocaldum sp. BRCS4]|nr:hypothetical protein [Methylocaldum sp. BRCS4]